MFKDNLSTFHYKDIVGIWESSLLKVSTMIVIPCVDDLGEHWFNNDLSDMAELPSFSPSASESTIEYRTSPLRQARMRPKLKAAPVYI